MNASGTRILFMVSHQSSSKDPTIKPMVIAFMGVAAMIFVVAGGIFIDQRNNIRTRIISELDMISSLRARDVQAWYQERWGDITVTARAPVISNAAKAYQKNQFMDHETRLAALNRMNNVRTVYGNHAIFLLGLDLKPFLSTQGHLPQVTPRLLDAAQEALQTQQVQMTSIIPGHEPSDPSVMVDFVAPLRSADTDDAPAVGVIVFRTDPAKHLFPRLNQWPTAATSGESILVAHDGQSVTYLNDLRGSRDAPLTVVRPLHQDLLGQILAESKTTGGAVTGIDYAGHHVLATYRPIVGTPWFIAAKVGIRELTAPIQQLLTEFIAGSLLAVAIAFSLLYLWFRSRTLQWHIMNEKKLRQQQKDLQDAYSSIQEAKRAKETLLDYMSHELRTPLAAVSGLATALLETRLNPKQNDYLGIIQSATQLLLGVFNNVLDMSKIEANKLQLDLAPVSVAEVLRTVTGMIEFQAQKNSLEINMECDKRIPPFVMGDSLRLQQILLNFATNAVKFTRRGSIFIGAQMETEKSDDLNPCTVRIRFTVRDTGIGISGTQIKSLFTPYSQLGPSSARLFGGTGLGLSICQHLVEKMGSRIDVTSTAGQGSTFAFTAEFPLATSAHNPATTSITPLRIIPCLEDTHILLIEDLELNRLICKELLESYGATVTTALDDLEADILLNRHASKFDVILLDIHLGIAKGWDIAQRIKGSRKTTTIPLIALTGDQTFIEESGYSPYGFNDAVPKPIDANRLITTILKWVPDRSHPAMPSDATTPGICPAVNQAQALGRINNNTDLYRRLVIIFERNAAEIMPEIRRLLAERQWDTVCDRLHSLKSLAGSVGADLILKKCDDLTKILRSSPTGDFHNQLREVEGALDQSLHSLRAGGHFGIGSGESGKQLSFGEH